MFNLQGSEIIVILLLALVVLGPEKLPDAIRRFSRTYAELKKMGSGFQTELKSALDEPMREMRETAEMVRDAADPEKIAAQAEAEKAADGESRSPDEGEPPIVSEPDEPAVGVSDPGPTVADATPPGENAGPDDAPAQDAVDARADDDAPPARPVNRIAAGNSSESIAAASAAIAAETAGSNGSEPTDEPTEAAIDESSGEAATA